MNAKEMYKQSKEYEFLRIMQEMRLAALDGLFTLKVEYKINENSLKKLLDLGYSVKITLYDSNYPGSQSTIIDWNKDA